MYTESSAWAEALKTLIKCSSDANKGSQDFKDVKEQVQEGPSKCYICSISIGFQLFSQIKKSLRDNCFESIDLSVAAK